MRVVRKQVEVAPPPTTTFIELTEDETKLLMGLMWYTISIPKHIYGDNLDKQKQLHDFMVKFNENLRARSDEDERH